MFAVVHEGKQYYHIKDVAFLLNRSISSLRYLCLHGGRGGRTMEYLRDGSRIYILASELTEYPFSDGSSFYHYKLVDGEYIKEKDDA